MGHWFQHVCQLGKAAFLSYCPVNSGHIGFPSVIYLSHLVDKTTVIPPSDHSWGCCGIFFLESIYDGSLILGCLPVGQGSFFELWPPKSGHFGFLSVIYSIHIVKKSTIIPPPNPSWGSCGILIRKYIWWIIDFRMFASWARQLFWVMALK